MLGSLAEKQVTTPDYYPLTMNALVHACNQISNRDPVVSYDERQVAEAVDTLRLKNLVYIFYGAESRVPKYKHMMREVLGLSPPELAALCVLMLRGAQTVGEVRGRTGRLYEFADLREAEATLEGLSERDDPLVVKLPRQAGRKEARYAHLLSGQPAVDEEAEATLEGLAQRDEPLVAKLPRQAGRKEARYAHLLSGPPSVEDEAEAQPSSVAPRARGGESERVARLEAEVERLSGELAEMRKQFEEFRKQFE